MTDTATRILRVFADGYGNLVALPARSFMKVHISDDKRQSIASELHTSETTSTNDMQRDTLVYD